jgi:FkbM family methyltransferase
MVTSSLPASSPRFLEALDLHRKNRFDEAAAAYQQAAEQMSDPLPALVNLAVALRQAGRPEKSLAALHTTLKLDPRNPLILHNLGEALRAVGKPEESLIAFRHLLREEPGFLPALAGLAKALEETGKMWEAEAVLGALLQRAPLDAAAWIRLARLLRLRHCDRACLAALERACALEPANPSHQFQRAQALIELGRYPEALTICQAILASFPDAVPVKAGRANALLDLGRLDEALAFLDKALLAHPDSPDLRMSRARARFFAGDDAGGFADYVLRAKLPGYPAPDVDAPLWDGKDMVGKTLLLCAGPGFGETIQFLRFVPLAAIRAARIVVSCPPELKSLAAAMNSVDEAVAEGDPVPAHDAWLPLPDLPHILGMGRNIANSPYIRPGRLAPGLTLVPPRGTLFKVGLIWAGNPQQPNDSQRSVSLQALLPLLEFPSVAFYSLQMGEAAKDMERHGAPGLIEDLSPLLVDFRATAQVISQLDLLIGVDTAVMHLAGALGKPGLLLLSGEPDWRWGLSGTSTAWYPTLRLVRQERPGDWRSAVQRAVALLDEALNEIVGSRVFLLHCAVQGGRAKRRYVMPIPARMAQDAGIAFLAARETGFGGYEYALRAFLDAHLSPNDVFLDVGAHWGIFSLHAATCPQGPVDVLAIEPLPANVERLKEWIEHNSLEERIEPIEAAVADKPGFGHLLTESSMGHRLAGPVSAEAGAVSVVTLDDLLEQRPQLAERRIWAKIDVEGFEPEAVAGLKRHLDAGRVAGLILERGRNFDRDPERGRFLSLLNRLASLGFTLWRFPHEGLGGVLVPYVFDADLCNVIALGPDEKPKPAYPRAKGPIPPITQPERARPAPAGRRERTLDHMAARAPDGGFWADLENLKPGAEERAQAVLPWLAGVASLLDLGSGLMAVKDLLPESVAYRPADLIPWTPETISVNLELAIPNVKTDMILLLEVIEFLFEPTAVLLGALNICRRLAVSYHLLEEGEDVQRRRAQGWVNDFNAEEFESLLRSCGWRIEEEMSAAGTRFFLAAAV